MLDEITIADEKRVADAAKIVKLINVFKADSNYAHKQLITLYILCVHFIEKYSPELEKINDVENTK